MLPNQETVAVSLKPTMALTISPLSLMLRAPPHETTAMCDNQINFKKFLNIMHVKYRAML
jgi:hypothetical protein